MSSFRRTHHQGSAVHDFELRFENRNSEDVHNEALAATLAERQRINDTARRAIQLENARLERQRLQQHLVQEEERVRLEEERVQEEIRLREIENRARQIPKVPARVPTPPPSTQPPIQEPKPTAPPTSQPAPAAASIAQPQPLVTQPQKTPSNAFQTTTPAQPHTTQPSNPFAQSAKSASNPFAPASTPATAPPLTQQPPAAVAPAQALAHASSTQSPGHLMAGVDRYVEIHKNLKGLRKYVNNAGEQNSAFKKAAGELRRKIRMAIGQCVPDKSKNKGPVSVWFMFATNSI